jgi:hypothetical protein
MNTETDEFLTSQGGLAMIGIEKGTGRVEVNNSEKE